MRLVYRLLGAVLLAPIAFVALLGAGVNLPIVFASARASEATTAFGRSGVGRFCRGKSNHRRVYGWSISCAADLGVAKGIAVDPVSLYRDGRPSRPPRQASL